MVRRRGGAASLSGAECPPWSLVSLCFFPQGWSCWVWEPRESWGWDEPPQGCSQAVSQQSSPQLPEKGKAEEESWWEGRYCSKKRRLLAVSQPRSLLENRLQVPDTWSRLHPRFAPGPGVPSPRADAWLGQMLPCPGLSFVGAQGPARHRDQSKHGAFSPPAKQTGSAPWLLWHRRTWAGSSQDQCWCP